MVAGDRRQPMIEPPLEHHRAVLGGEIFGEIAHQRRHVGAAQQRGRFPKQHGAGAEAFDDETERFEFRRMVDERRCGAGSRSTTAGESRICRATPLFSRSRFSLS